MPILAEVPEADIRVFHRTDDGRLGVIDVNKSELPPDEPHAHAILHVCEYLVETGQGYNQPVLALIQGGKNEKQ